MAVTVQLMQSPCVLTSKALSVTFSPSSGCSRLLGVGVLHGLGIRGGVSGPGSLLRLTSCSSWGVLGALGRLAASSRQLVPYCGFLRHRAFSVLPAQPLLLAALAAPGSPIVATFHVPLKHVGSPPYSLGASRALVWVVGWGGPLTVQTYPAIPSIYTIHPRDGVSLCVQRSRQEAW